MRLKIDHCCRLCCDLNINQVPEEGSQPATLHRWRLDTMELLHAQRVQIGICKFTPPKCFVSNGRCSLDASETYLLRSPLLASIFPLAPALFGCCLARALWLIGLLAAQTGRDRCNDRRLDHPLEIRGGGDCGDCRNKRSVSDAGILARLLWGRQGVRAGVDFNAILSLQLLGLCTDQSNAQLF